MGNSKLCASNHNKDTLKINPLLFENEELTFDVTISNIRGRNLKNVRSKVEQLP